jgi:hypothetical protein
VGLRTQTGEPCMLLLKLGQKEHMQMLRKGLLYMNSLVFFTSLEADSAQGDPYEGTDSIIQPCHIGEFIIDPRIPGLDKIHVVPSDLAGPVRIALQRTSSCNIFCMFAVNRPIKGPILPKSYKWFGDSFLLFTHTQEFLSRVISAAKRQGLKGEGQLVEYYDEMKFSGDFPKGIGRFRKRSIYSHQSEYRIALEAGVQGPFRFEIGDLRDITSEVFPLDSADDVLKFRPEDAEAAGLSWD